MVAPNRGSLLQLMIPFTLALLSIYCLNPFLSPIQIQTVKQRPLQKQEQERVVYLLPQFGKSGSSTLRATFNRRGEFYGNSRMDDRAVVSEIRRKCTSATGTEDENYPFVSKQTKFEKYRYPSFWRLKIPPESSRESKRECLEHVIDSAWKFRQGAAVADAAAENNGLREEASSSSSSSPSAAGRYNLKPVVQTSMRCPPSRTTAAKNTTATTGERVKCRRLVQMRDPLTWIESSFNYFCTDCKDRNKFCGAIIDARCGPKHRKKGDHETIQSWARKFGNLFTRTLHGDERMLAGGTWSGGMSPDGWTHPDIVELPKHVNDIVRETKEEGHCFVSLEDPHRMSKIEACLGDAPGFYKEKLNITEHTSQNKREEKARLDPSVTAELREILAPDIALYNAMFPFLADVDDE